MLEKIKASLLTIKTNILNAWASAQPTIAWLGGLLSTVLDLLAKLSNQFSLLIGIAIGYKLEPVLKIVGPLIKVVLEIVSIPFKILGWL